MPEPLSNNKGQPLRLHIGGEEVKEGWKIVNIQQKPGVDYIGSATDLSVFENESVDEIYASHIYEHLDYRQEFFMALAEAFRVLTKGGKIYIGVPDLEGLARLILAPNRDMKRAWDVMRMVYGGHIDEFDYHKGGYTFLTLGTSLYQTGFRDIYRVNQFGIFNDTTTMMFEDVPISLNVKATKPLVPEANNPDIVKNSSIESV